MLNNLNILLLNKKTKLFTSFVKISEQYIGCYAKYGLFNLIGSNSSHKIWNLGSSLCFSEVILISFVMLKNKKKRLLE